MYATHTMLSLADLYFTDADGNYRFQWSNQAFVDQIVHPGDEEDDNEYYQALAKYNYLSEHLNDGSNYAANYRINIYDFSTNSVGAVVHSEVVNGFSTSVNLSDGEYVWEIEALDAYGNVITRSEKAFISTYFNDWGNDPTYIYKNSSHDRLMASVGECFDYVRGVRTAAAGSIISENATDYFMVCGAAQCGNEEAWEWAEDAGIMYSVSNAFGDFEGEFTLTGNCLITCGGIYEYENGQWNYKVFTEPWLLANEARGTTDYLLLDNDSPENNKLYKWDTAQNRIVEVLTASSEIYGISDRYYFTQNGVYSIADNTQVLNYNVRYGEHLIYDDMFFNVFARDVYGNAMDELEYGETGSVAVKYFFFDNASGQTTSQEITLFSGQSNMVIDSEEVFSARVGNCICFVVEDDMDDDYYNYNPLSYIYVHEIKSDGTIEEYSFTYSTWYDINFTTDENNKLICTVNGTTIRVFNDIELDMGDCYTPSQDSGSSMQITGNQNGISFTEFYSDATAGGVTVEYSRNNFANVIKVNGLYCDGVDTYLLNAGDWQCRVSDEYSNSSIQTTFSATAPAAGPAEITADADNDLDIFFARTNGVWDSKHVAKHAGFISEYENGWSGTHERISIAGKNIIEDVFCGSLSADNILLLTDDTNGDALFFDDIYSAFGDKARLTQIKEIRAGAGNDVIDMTSPKFYYDNYGMTIYGGDGDDTIWATNGMNFLYGDAGNDRIVGASGYDVIVGGSGNDSMHGGGGHDAFCFGENWGVDTVEQLADGYVDLYIANGSMNNWNAATKTYTDGTNSITVIGTDNITLYFGENGAMPAGAFTDAASSKIFEDINSGMLA